MLKYCSNSGIDIITYGDKRYPLRLKTLEDPPVLIYCIGTFPNFDDRLCIGVVGTRKISAYGMQSTYKISYELASASACIVSGMALGVDAVAGNSAAITIGSLIAAFYNSFGIAAMVFMGQNIGAQKPERVRKSLVCCLLGGAISGEALGILSYFIGEFCIGIIVGMNSTLAIEYGMLRMLYINLFTVFLAVTGVLSNALQAYGYPFFGSISSLIFTLGFRVFWMSVIYVKMPTYTVVMQCFTVSLLLNMLFFKCS